jgi:hypothetical protein
MADELKRRDQEGLLQACLNFTDSGEWAGMFTYPSCGYDLVVQGLVTEDRKITMAGRAALWLLGKGADPTESKSSVEFKL